jgi:hypothetical protein
MPTTKVKIKGEMVIINDWTKDTIILDLTNSLGEQYHFEIEPEADANSVPTRPANDDTVLNMWMPIATKIKKE